MNHVAESVETKAATFDVNVPSTTGHPGFIT